MTMVRMNVAKSEFTFSTPTLAKMAVSAANPADRTAQSCQDKSADFIDGPHVVGSSCLAKRYCAFAPPLLLSLRWGWGPPITAARLMTPARRFASVGACQKLLHSKATGLIGSGSSKEALFEKCETRGGTSLSCPRAN